MMYLCANSVTVLAVLISKMKKMSVCQVSASDGLFILRIMITRYRIQLRRKRRKKCKYIYIVAKVAEFSSTFLSMKRRHNGLDESAALG